MPPGQWPKNKKKQEHHGPGEELGEERAGDQRVRQHLASYKVFESTQPTEGVIGVDQEPKQMDPKQARPYSGRAS